MKTHTKSESAPLRCLAKFVLAAALLVCPALLLADPDEKNSAEQSAKQLAEKIREDLNANKGALQDLVRRATENGGQLQLDVEEFERLLANGAIDKLPGRFGQDVDDESEEPEAKKEAKGDAIKGFLDMFQRQISGRKVGKNEREHGSVLNEYRPVIEQARKSTVGLVAGRKQLALGTVVDSGGYIITKASEVKGKDLRCVFQGGVRVAAKILDIYEPLDLALVKVEADDLEAAQWSDSSALELGSFLAAPGIGEDPIAIGVASVAPRSLSEKTKGYLGVEPEGTDDGVRLRNVLGGTPAAKAGLKVGDIVIAIDDSELTSRAEFHRLVAGRSPGEEVRFKILRGEEEKTLTAKLASREEFAQQNGGGGGSSPRVDRMNLMGGKLSDNRGGYASALQTDLTLGPEECGGPVVNLDGEVIGVNIARGGRVKSFALPAGDLKALLGNVKSGKFTITDLSELKSAVAAAENNLKKAEAALQSAREAKQAAEEALKAAADKKD